MRKHYLVLIAVLIVVAVLFAGCNTELKAASKDLSRITTLTPFQSIATFTPTNTPQTSVGSALTNESYSPMTLDAQEVETNTEISTTETVLPTSMPTSAPDTETSQPPPTSILYLPTSTSKPPQSLPRTNTPKPPADTNTPKPASATFTPHPAENTNTPVPPADTNTPLPPVDTNTPAPPTATAPPAACVYSGNSSYEAQVIVLINQERTERGLSALSQNSSLTQAARLHSQDMACNDNWSHTGSDGSTLGSRLLAAGYSYSYAAENIATSSSQYFSPASVVSMWMNSTGHRANILNPNMVHIGVGFRYAGDVNILPYDAYYTADFGAPP